jgi:hypothetical protein
MVVGQAYEAAGYTLEHMPVQWAGGRFRFSKPMPGNIRATIEYQVLIYTNSAFAAPAASRFRVHLHRSRLVKGRPEVIMARMLSALVVSDFGVAILPSADYWWPYSDAHSLGQALAEAGHLVVGYGMPWLAGELTPE